MTMSIISGNDPDVIIFFTSTIVYATIGILGNLLIILVYASKRHSLSQQKNILALAVVDFTISMFVMPYAILHEMKAIENDILCRGMEVITHGTVIFSNLVLCLICVERFVKVWKPTKIISERLTLFWILIALGFSVIMSIPAATMFMVISANTADAASPKVCQFSNKTVGELGANIYSYILLFINISILCTLIILYSLIYCRLYKKSKALTDHPKSDAVGTSILKVEPVQTAAVGSEVGTSQSQGVYSHTFTSNSEFINTKIKPTGEDLARRENERKTEIVNGKHRDKKPRAKQVTFVSTKTSTMLFICTFIYIITWIPFFTDIFGITNSLSLRYLFFFSHATNPIVYGIVNNKLRKFAKQMICR